VLPWRYSFDRPRYRRFLLAGVLRMLSAGCILACWDGTVFSWHRLVPLLPGLHWFHKRSGLGDHPALMQLWVRVRWLNILVLLGLYAVILGSSHVCRHAGRSCRLLRARWVPLHISSFPTRLILIRS
jgi:hypothetical protein